MAIVLNEGATILNARFSVDPSEYAGHVRWTLDKAKCRITADFINRKQKFELEVLSSAYESGTAELDASAPEVKVRKTSAIRWDSAVVKGVKLSIPFAGIGYDSGSAAMSEVADEIRAIRKYISRKE